MAARAGEPKRAAGQPPRTSGLGRAWRVTKWIVGGPFAVFPSALVVRNARYIAWLARVARSGPPPDERLQFGPDRSIDMDATAFCHGISVPALEQHMLRRRIETARTAYLSFALGWVAFLAWLACVATMPWADVYLVSILEFLPFCAIFFLLAFKSALHNYQLRTRTLVTPGEYLRAPTGFWPT